MAADVSQSPQAEIVVTPLLATIISELRNCNQEVLNKEKASSEPGRGGWNDWWKKTDRQNNDYGAYGNNRGQSSYGKPSNEKPLSNFQL